MNKALWVLGVIALTLILLMGAICGLYIMVETPSVQPISLVAGEGEKAQDISLWDYTWYQPVCGGLVYKPFAGKQGPKMEPRVKVDEYKLPLGHSSMLGMKIKISNEAGVVFEGDSDTYADFVLPENGEYSFEVNVGRDKGEGKAYGWFFYKFKVDVKVKPQFSISDNTVSQGEIVAVSVKGTDPGTRPTGESDLGNVNFVTLPDGFVAFVPVTYNKEIGEHTINIAYGEFAEVLTVNVEKTEYQTENHYTREYLEEKAIAEGTKDDDDDEATEDTNSDEEKPTPKPSGTPKANPTSKPSVTPKAKPSPKVQAMASRGQNILTNGLMPMKLSYISTLATTEIAPSPMPSPSPTKSPKPTKTPKDEKVDLTPSTPPLTQEEKEEQSQLELDAKDSEAAAKEYREKIWPLLDVWDDGIGWQELSFTSPVDMPITGAYGSHISLDDGKQISRNSGIDITAPEGTEVLSPNAGRVLFAARLKLTGYTVVIEHGGGLKSFYYHLDDITINQGGMVERGTPIGTVGDTGTDEPPHLTMEMKIGNQSIDPVPLFRGVSAIYRKN